MAELSSSTATTASSCCAPGRQATCCDPSAKAECCGQDDGCSCTEGASSPDGAVTEVEVERLAAHEPVKSDTPLEPNG